MARQGDAEKEHFQPRMNADEHGYHFTEANKDNGGKNEQTSVSSVPSCSKNSFYGKHHSPRPAPA